jgi:hypothetical protein
VELAAIRQARCQPSRCRLFHALEAVMPFFADEEWREGNRRDLDEVTQDRLSLAGM